jgi:hypothetical protein
MKVGKKLHRLLTKDYASVADYDCQGKLFQCVIPLILFRYG